MADHNWPGIAVTSKPAKKRGGGSYTTFTAQAVTVMSCGARIVEDRRGDNENLIRAAATSAVAARARRHTTVHGCG